MLPFDFRLQSWEEAVILILEKPTVVPYEFHDDPVAWESPGEA